MIVQLVVICVIIIAGYLFQNSKGNLKDALAIRRKYIFIVTILFILQSGLRNVAVGPDTFQYQEMFEDDVFLPWSHIFQNFIDTYKYGVGRDPGYPLLVKAFSYISIEYRSFLFFIAILFFSSFGYFLYKNTNSILDLVFAYVLYQALFYSFFSITGIRQTIVTAFTLFAFEYTKRISIKHLFLFTLIILLASTIHKSVLLFLPIYFLANIKKSRFVYAIALIGFPIMVLLKEKVALSLAVASSVQNYMAYVTSSTEAGTPTFTFLIFLIVLLGWFFMKNTLKQYPESYRIYNVIAMAFLLTPLTWVDPNLMRVVQYFSIFMMVFIPKVIDSMSLRPKYLRKLIYIAMISVLLLLTIKNKAEYKFMWQDMELGDNYFIEE